MLRTSTLQRLLLSLLKCFSLNIHDSHTTFHLLGTYFIVGSRREKPQRAWAMEEVYSEPFLVLLPKCPRISYCIQGKLLCWSVILHVYVLTSDDWFWVNIYNFEEFKDRSSEIKKLHVNIYFIFIFSKATKLVRQMILWLKEPLGSNTLTASL